MPIRTTIDMPEALHQSLRHRAEQSGSSVRALIIRAIKQVYSETKKGKRLIGPPVCGSGKLGPLFPEDENPHNIVFS